MIYVICPMIYLLSDLSDDLSAIWSVRWSIWSVRSVIDDGPIWSVRGVVDSYISDLSEVDHDLSYLSKVI